MRWPLLGNSLVAKVPVVLKLPLVKVLENALLFFRRLLNAFVEFILGRMLHLLPFVLDRLSVPGTVYTPAPTRLPRVGRLLCSYPKAHRNEKSQ